MADPDRSIDGIARTLESWRSVPAVACDRCLSVVCANRLARMLCPAFAVGANLAADTACRRPWRRPFPHHGDVDFPSTSVGLLRMAYQELLVPSDDDVLVLVFRPVGIDSALAFEQLLAVDGGIAP